MIELDLAIITYKRPELLRKCLESIVKQTKKPDRVLVIDNDKLASAKVVADSFKKKIVINYVVEKKQGIPYARNKAIKINQAEYLGFVDDDCVLGKNWVKEGLKGIKKYKSAYVVGKTQLLNENSLVARAQFYHYQQWFLTKLNKKTKKIKAQNLDTKNIIFDMKIFSKHKLKFDEMYSLTSIGGGEDIDMGLQLKELGYGGFYVKKMLLKHREVDKFRSLIKKAFWRGRSSYLYADKWGMKNQIVNKYHLNWLRWFRDFWKKPYDNAKLKKDCSIRNKLMHILIKIYDRVWLLGFIKEESGRIK